MPLCLTPITGAFGQLLQREALLRAAQTYPFRIWVDDTGKHQTIAKYLRHNKKSVTIMKENKLVLEIPFSRLSERDRNYIESFGNNSPQFLATKSSKDTTKQIDPAPSAALNKKSDESSIENLVSRELRRIDLPPAQQETIAHLEVLKPFAEKNVGEVRETLNRLLKGWPKEPTDELVDAVALCAESGIFSIDEAALMLLMKSDPSRHFAIFERVVERPDFNLRMIAYQSLTAINDDRALDVLMSKFDSDDNVFIGKLLPEFGDRAEVALQEHLNHIEPDHVLVTVSILAELGTKRSIQSLTSLAKDSDKVAIRQQANTAIKKIEARLAK